VASPPTRRTALAAPLRGLPRPLRSIPLPPLGPHPAYTHNLKAAELKLDDAQVKRLDEASAFELGYPYDFMQRVQGRW
jgi:hypothetical protein